MPFAGGHFLVTLGYAQDELLTVAQEPLLRGPHVVPGIEQESALCKTRTLNSILFLQPEHHIFKGYRGHYTHDTFISYGEKDAGSCQELPATHLIHWKRF